MANPRLRRPLTAAVLLGLLAAAHAPAVRADVFDDVPEARDYVLVYRLDIPDTANFNTTAVPYTVDSSAAITTTFDRVAYYLELVGPDGARQYAYASMAAFTTDARKLGVPTTGSGALFQRPVADMNVYSNVPSVATGTGLPGGNIEFWPTNYSTANSASVPGADGAVYDFGDSPTADGGYGSLQIHNYAAHQTVLAYNNWGAAGTAPSDLGIGNNAVAQTDGTTQLDWTFRGNAATYTVKRLTVLVHPGPPPTELAMSQPTPRAIFQRDNTDLAWVPIAGQFSAEVTTVRARAVPMPGYRGTATDWRDVDLDPQAGRFHGHLLLAGGWYRIEVMGVGSGAHVDNAVVERVGVGEVFVTAGQSNSANHGNPPLMAADDRVSAYGPSGWRHADDPQPVATGDGGSPWPPLGDALAAWLDVPIGFAAVGWGGTSVSQWQVGGTLYPRLAGALAALGPRGVRAVLWHQGETDASAGMSTDDYARQLSALITASRHDAGYDVPWGVALVSFLPGGTPEQMAPIVAGQHQVIRDVPLVFEGPNTDELTGSDWRWDGIHFNEAGLREHARRWAVAIQAAGLIPPQVTPPPAVYLPYAER